MRILNPSGVAGAKSFDDPLEGTEKNFDATLSGS
jgi:hypothetical protein